MSRYKRRVKLNLNLSETSEQLRQKADALVVRGKVYYDYQNVMAKLLQDAAEVMEKIEDLEKGGDVPQTERGGRWAGRWTPEARAHQAKLMRKVNRKLGRGKKKRLVFVERKGKIVRAPRKRRRIPCKYCSEKVMNINMGNHVRYVHGMTKNKKEGE